MKLNSILLLLLVQLCVISAFGQIDKPDLKFIGYENQSPVFQISYSKTNKLVSEDFAAQEEAVVDEAYSDGKDQKLQVIIQNEASGTSKPINISNDIQNVICYANGNYVVVSDYYGLDLIKDEMVVNLKFQEDTFDDDDFMEKIIDMTEKFGIANLSFAPDTNTLHYPKFNRLKIRSYNLVNNAHSEIDLGKIDDYGGSILMPFEASENIYFLFSGNGPYELFQLNKKTRQFVKAPFEIGRKGSFGLKYHPFKQRVLFIYRNLPLVYDFEIEKFQIIDLTKHLKNNSLGLKDLFKALYYSKSKNEWRFATLEDEKLKTYQLKVNPAKTAFNLSLKDVEATVEEQKMKNLSPQEELVMSLKKVMDLPKPLSNETKDSLKILLTDFDKKYKPRFSEKEVKEALLMSYMVRIDTSLFSEKVVSKHKNILLDKIKEDELNFKMRLGLQLIGRVATNQPPVHPARVEVIKALVDDYLKENKIASDEALNASGLDLLILALNANEQYELAAEYLKTKYNFIEEHELYGKRETLETLIYAQINAEKFNEALMSIASYKAGLDRDSGNYLSSSIKIEVQESFAHAGLNNYKQALRILSDANERFYKSKEDIFGSETKVWLEFSLLYAYTEIYFEMNNEQKEASLTTLMKFLLQNENGFQYKSMFASISDLLNKIDKNDKLKDLTKPR